MSHHAEQLFLRGIITERRVYLPLLPSPSSLLPIVFDGLGDVMKPTVTPQAGDVDTSMANMASSK